MPADGTPVVEGVDLVRTHRSGESVIRSVDGVSIWLAPGEVVAIMGPSGSGKTTLLHLLAGIDEPDEGVARMQGVDWRSLHGREEAAFRRRTCSMVAQGMTLLPAATAAENVEVPLLLDGMAADERRGRVTDALHRVDLATEASKLPDQLSGGQQQRVAIARALVTHPAVVLADEPTASLDSTNALAVTRLLLDAAGELGTAVLMVTHDPEVAAQGSRVIRLHSGRLETRPNGARR